MDSFSLIDFGLLQAPWELWEWSQKVVGRRWSVLPSVVVPHRIIVEHLSVNQNEIMSINQSGTTMTMLPSNWFLVK